MNEWNSKRKGKKEEKKKIELKRENIKERLKGRKKEQRKKQERKKERQKERKKERYKEIVFECTLIASKFSCGQPIHFFNLKKKLFLFRVSRNWKMGKIKCQIGKKNS